MQPAVAPAASTSTTTQHSISLLPAPQRGESHPWVLLQAIEAAQAAGKAADTFYCLALLEETGILTVPGSGFGQAKGTFHLRTTILPPIEQMHTMVSLFQDFHKKFLAKYS